MPGDHIMRATAKVTAVSLLVVAAACDNVLEVENLSNPDIERVFATPAAVEQTIGSGFQACHNTMTNTSLMPVVLVLALESYSQLNNFSMGPRAAIPRVPIPNALGAPSVFGEYSGLQRGTRLTSNAMRALDALMAADLSPADGVLGSPEQDLRARAFGFFAIGCQLGWTAMVYDSAAVITPATHPDSIPPLTHASAVMDTAIMMLDSAVAIASDPDAEDGFPTEAGWIGGTEYEADDFVRIVRSYRARFRAGVARTPTERADVAWNLVVADTDNGITSNLLVQSGGSTGWNIGFIGSNMYQDGRAWSQISLMYFGMADTSGAYDAWIGQSLTDRSPFLVRTPDLRWPQGATREAQVANSPRPTSVTGKPYVDALEPNETAQPWGWSYYQFQRTAYIRFASPSNRGPWPHMLKSEIDLLGAEGHIRLGNWARATALIDAYRVPNNLPSLAAYADTVTPVPGGTAAAPVPGGQSCVPRVPTSAGNDTKCGSLFEAMKYEKRMETSYTSFGRMWIDSRGWGDLIEGTGLEFPVPFQEMAAREKTSYPLGGLGGTSAAAKGTYGF
jgi:hypothetical protein